MSVAIQERPTEARVVRWVEWRCYHCHYYLASYNPSVPCHLNKVCPKCKRENEKDRRNSAA